MTAVLITGATGKQGGSVITSLLRRNAPFEILAVTRDTTSASAQRLSKKGSNIKLVQGNLDNPADIFKNARNLTSLPIWGVFSVQTFTGNSDSEIRQGEALIDESIKQGVTLFVYTSVDRGGEASINQPTNIPQFISKHKIEQYLLGRTRNGAMNWSILRPTSFFENFAPGFSGKVFNTFWKIGLKGRPLQLVAISDIGYFGAEAFMNPDEYKGKALSLAGDELTFDQMARIYKQKIGKDVPTTFSLPCYLLMALMKDFGYMFKWFHDEGYKANISELKQIHPDLKDFSAWLEKESGFMTQ